jgi:hypothetical protein
VTLHKGRVGVTHHALIRFLQRVEGIDIDAAVDKLVPDDLQDQIDVVGPNGKFPGPPGYRLVVKDGVVITIVPS